jgi:hypothetical protein
MAAERLKAPLYGLVVSKGVVSVSGNPRVLISITQQYAISSDGQRFLVNLAADEGAASPITLIYDWKPDQKK